MKPPQKVHDLVERFQRNRNAYRTGSYGEAEVRKEFVDPFFKALGWDVDNERGYAEPYKHVIHEASVQVEGAPKAPDYSFRVGGTRKFFVETKRPSTNLKDGTAPAFQLRRYGWSAGLALSVLTDFEEFAVYDCKIQPHKGDKASMARVLYLTVDEYLHRWNEIADIFARKSVLQGSFDRYAASTVNQRGTSEVDDVFLEEIESWRELLAQNIARNNPSLSRRELNAAVQRTIDRIVFLRICEDRGIEDYGQLRKAAASDGIYDELSNLFHHADNKYNSGLFHFRSRAARASNPDTYTLSLTVDDAPIRQILDDLYYPESPYEFSVLPADILGQVYERFLGSTIELEADHRAVVQQKPEVRKAGGVYYTPTFVVDYIVGHALDAKLEGQRPDQVAELRVLDPACGSGHFLVHAYQHLLDWHLNWYIEEGLQYKKYKNRVREGSAGDPVLTTGERKRILLNNVYGVDIDPQAVEVTKLSLLLKVLEGETGETIENQMQLFAERALPDLANNIKCGNSLIAPDYYSDQQLSLVDEDELYQVNPFSWEKGFPEIFSADGFDVILGNPPYILLEDEFRNDDQLAYFREHYEVASYKLDTYHLFMERALELAADDGYVSMITPSNFLTNNYLADLRRYLVTHSQIDHVMIIDGGVFRGISVDNAIWLLKAGQVTEKPFPVQHVELQKGFQLAERRLSHVAVDPTDKHVLFTGSGGPELAALWKRLQENCETLREVAHVNFGKQLRSQKDYPDDIIGGLDDLSAVPDGYRPCYTGADITRYEVTWNGRACLDKQVARRGGTWKADRQNAKNKLLCRQIGKYPFFAMDQEGHQVLNRAFMVNLRESANLSPELLLGLLNSRLLRALWLHKFYDQRSTFPKIKGTYLKKLPVPWIDPKDEERRTLAKKIHDDVETIRLLIRRRRSAKAEHQRAVLTRQIEALDESIEETVFTLYGLNDIERDAVGREFSDLIGEEAASPGHRP